MWADTRTVLAAWATPQPFERKEGKVSCPVSETGPAPVHAPFACKVMDKTCLGTCTLHHAYRAAKSVQESASPSNFCKASAQPHSRLRLASGSTHRDLAMKPYATESLDCLRPVTLVKCLTC